MTSQQKQIVGWEEWVSLPKLGLPALKAKIDTGAKTSSLHAFSIEPYQYRGKDKVRFGIHPNPDKPDLTLYCTADLVGSRDVISSNGEKENRHIIKTQLTMGDVSHDIEVSLTNRETMTFRMLIGRSALEECELVVDPLSSFNTGTLSFDLYDDLISKHTASERSLKIGILSREAKSYSTKRLVEAAEQRGHIVEVLDTTRCYIKIVSGKPEVYLAKTPLTGFDVIIPRIGASITFYGMAIVRQFEAMGIYTLNPANAIGRSRDKLLAHQLLAQKNIGMPTTAFARNPDDADHLIELVGGAPTILKLLEGTQGKGVVLADTKKAGESVIGAFQGLKISILVQQFIKEAGGADIRCFVIGNKVVASMIRQAAEGEFRSNLHQGGKAASVKITPEERKTAVKAAKALGLRVAGVDLLRSSEGPKIMEVNSSPGLEGIETLTKKDIADAIIEYIENNAHIKIKV